MSEGVLDGSAEQQHDDVLARRALAVLDANWLGHGTRPSRPLPAPVELGLRVHRDGVRALESGPRRDGASLAVRGPVASTGSCRTSSSPRATAATSQARSSGSPSGLAECPVRRQDVGNRAAAASRDGGSRGVPRSPPTASGRRRSCESSLPKLARLARVPLPRADAGRRRASWRSGIPGSPGWTTRRSGTRRSRRLDPAKARSPTTSESTSSSPIPPKRPTDVEYDRYVYLVGLFRELDYGADRIHDATPFALQPVLFNSLLVQANRDLAEIARLLGDDPEPFEAWAEQTAAASTTKLWNESEARVRRLRRPGGKRVAARTAAGLAPLYAGVPSGERAREMIDRLAASRVAVGSSGWAVTSRLARRSRLRADPLLARAGLADPQLGPAARSRPVRFPLPRRTGPARVDRAEPAAGSGSTTARVTGAGHGGDQLRLDGRADARHPLDRDRERKERAWRTPRIAPTADGTSTSNHERRE